MRNIGKTIGEFVAAAAVATLLSTSAIAVLIEEDLIENSGLGLLTVDTDTDLEWLDLSETHRVAFNDAVSGGYSELGFRAATLSEVAELYDHAGVVDDTGVEDVLNRDAVQLLLDLMGCSGNCSAGNPYGQGYAEMEPADPDAAELLYVQLNENGTTAVALAVHDPVGYSKNIASLEGSTYLVRPVPEPSSWLLQLASLAAVGLLQLRSRRA